MKRNFMNKISYFYSVPFSSKSDWSRKKDNRFITDNYQDTVFLSCPY